jgi:predicted Zn finger-like uncharacterized protein
VDFIQRKKKWDSSDMITRCPECGAKFRISVDLIRAEDSTVRCGDCRAVFDARAQLVDEATESAYLADRARERAARRRVEQEQARRQLADSHAREQQDNGFADDDYSSHGEEWSHTEQQRQPVQQRERQPERPTARGQLIIDRRESTADIDFDNADTIAYQPLDTGARTNTEARATDKTAYTARSTAVRAPDVELAGSDDPGVGASVDYARRIDPLIDPDDRSIEFERTVSLDDTNAQQSSLSSLTGIESDYSTYGGSQYSGAGAARHRATDSAETDAQALETSLLEENAARRPGTDDNGAYMAEHQLGRAQSSGPRDYSADPEFVTRQLETPRSERHLDPELQSAARSRTEYADDYAARRGTADARGYSDARRYAEAEGFADSSAYADNRYDTYDEASDTYQSERQHAEASADSATSMRQHLSEREVAIDSDDEQHDRVDSRASLWWLVLAALAIGCAAALYARDDIARSNLPEPVRAAFCSVTGCELPVGTDLAELELLRQKVYSHASIDNALVVSVDVVNNAHFPQPYPVLSITMANSSGEAVAERDFQPADYLENYTGEETLAAGKPTRINIDIVDPGEDAQSFEMQFR